MAEQVDVVVVGGGPAGLSTAGALSKLGRRAVVLERDRRIGTRWESRYERLHLHTARRFSGLAHYPIERCDGRYPSKDAFARYLRDYADHFGLDVRTGVDVNAVRPHDGGWDVAAPARSWIARAVVIATGLHDEPVLPDWPGRTDYRGRLLHSSEFRSAPGLIGGRVLVVGLGNSGAEIAAELAQDGAREVDVAVRTPPPIAHREILGVPIQLFGIALAGFPVGGIDRVAGLVRRASVGDLGQYGLGASAWGPFEAKRPPVIDVGFLQELKRRRIIVRPALARLSGNGAVFADGTENSYAAIIAATGFRPGSSRYLDAELLGRPGLYSVGFGESVRGALFEINRESRVVARELSAYLERTGG
jgi:putative flavoprotein involved in K+ transport